MKEAGIFVAFEESTRQIVANAATFGWDLPALEKKKLFFLDARLSPDVVQGRRVRPGRHACACSRPRRTICTPTRIVFDGIDVLLGLLDDPVEERREIYRIRDWLAQDGVDRHHHAEGRDTTMTTATASCSSWSTASSCSGIRWSTDRRSATCA